MLVTTAGQTLPWPQLRRATNERFACADELLQDRNFIAARLCCDRKDLLINEVKHLSRRLSQMKNSADHRRSAGNKCLDPQIEDEEAGDRQAVRINREISLGIS